MIQESIFQGQNQTKKTSNTSLYFYEERSLGNNVLSGGLRWLSIENVVLPSISYML